MTDNVIQFPRSLPEFLEQFCARIEEGVSDSELRAFWDQNKQTLQSDWPYDDLLEFFIAVDDATRPFQSDATELLPLPPELICRPDGRLRLVTPLGEYARSRYVGFSAAYPYVLPLEATFGADDPALFIVKAGMALFPPTDPVSVTDAGHYADKDLASFAIGGANRWLCEGLIQWVAPRIDPEATSVLRIIVGGLIEGFSKPVEVHALQSKYGPGGFTVARKYRTREMLALYAMRRGASPGFVQSLFGALWDNDGDSHADLSPGGYLFYCLDRRNLDTMVRGAERVGEEEDWNRLSGKEWVVRQINGAFVDAQRSEAGSVAPLSMETTKLIFDRLIRIWYCRSLGEVIYKIPDDLARDALPLEPSLSTVMADCLGGGQVLGPPSPSWIKAGSECFYAYGLKPSDLGRLLGHARVNAGHASEAVLVFDSQDKRNGVQGGGYALSTGAYRHVIEQAIESGFYELASSIVAFLVFAVGYRTRGTFSSTSWRESKWREMAANFDLMAPVADIPEPERSSTRERFLRLAAEAVSIEGAEYHVVTADLSAILTLVPLGLGLKGGSRVEKALRAVADWAKESGAKGMAARLLGYLPEKPSETPGAKLNIVRLISGGEDHTCEFKASIRFDVNKNEIEKKGDRYISLAWLKELASFLNADGGVLLLGVADDKSVVGVEHDAFENADKRGRFIRDRISRTLGLNVHRYLRVSELSHEGHQLFVIEARPASAPVWLTREPGAKDDLYIRTGSECRLLEGKALAEFVLNRTRAKK